MSKTIEIPDGMHAEIQRLIDESPGYGYENVDEYVREAVRRYMMSPL